MADTRALSRTLGERLAKARKVTGMTQEQIAHELGISVKSVRRYEDDTHTPKRQTVIAWANITDVPLAWLIDDDLGTDRATRGSTARKLHSRFNRTIRCSPNASVARYMTATA